MEEKNGKVPILQSPGVFLHHSPQREALFAREGGLGILLVKETMDGVTYTYENGKNILTIEKKLTEPEDVCL